MCAASRHALVIIIVFFCPHCSPRVPTPTVAHSGHTAYSRRGCRAIGDAGGSGMLGSAPCVGMEGGSGVAVSSRK